MSERRTVEFKIFRWDPEGSDPPTYQTYQVPLGVRSVVGEGLEYIYSQLDGTLAYRYECRSRQCGSCAVQIDGRPALFCMDLVGERSSVCVEPLGMLPIIKDLVTDRGPILEPLYGIQPFKSQPAEGDVLPVDVPIMETVKRAEECAECGLCTAVCPAYASTEFKGPMFFNKLYRQVTDSRDTTSRKAEILDAEIFDCKTCYRCEEICPHELPIRTIEIQALQQHAVQSREG